MAKKGYIMAYADYKDMDEDQKWMEDYGCTEIHIDTEEHEIDRPQWRELIKSVSSGDVIIVPSLNNAVRGIRELSNLLTFCLKKSIRLIAFRDHIDSCNALFPNMRTSDFLKIIASFSTRRMGEVDNNGKSRNTKTRVYTPKVGMAKAERTKLIINLYLTGMPISEIWKASGFKSRSSVFRVLEENGIDFNRGHSQKEIRSKKGE